MDIPTTAVLLARCGFSVVPVEHLGKRPDLPRWAEHQTVMPSVEQVREWFSSGEHNIGVVTGAISNLVVLDADTTEAIHEIERRGIPPTVTVTTAKGRHWWFRHPRFPVGNKVGLLPGVDVRGDGGLVVTPPSIHSSGVVYEFDETPWEWMGEGVPLPPCPHWLLADLASRTTTTRVVTLSDPDLLPGEAWHGGAPDESDLTKRMQLLLRLGDRGGRYKNERDQLQRFRVMSALTAACAREGLGLRSTIRLLAQSPIGESGSGGGWYPLLVKNIGAEDADMQVSRAYLVGLDLPGVGEARAVRDELVQVRDAMLRWPWRYRDSSALRVMGAALKVAWMAGQSTVELASRRVAELAVVDSRTASKAASELADMGWLSFVGRGGGEVPIYELLVPTAAAHTPQRLSAEYFPFLLHPAFYRGGQLNVVVWLNLGTEPVQLRDLTAALGTTMKTLRPQLERLEAHGLAARSGAGWVAAGGPDTLNEVATANGGTSYVERLRERHREDRRLRRAGLTEHEDD